MTAEHLASAVLFKLRKLRAREIRPRLLPQSHTWYDIYKQQESTNKQRWNSGKNQTSNETNPFEQRMLVLFLQKHPNSYSGPLSSILGPRFSRSTVSPVAEKCMICAQQAVVVYLNHVELFLQPGQRTHEPIQQDPERHMLCLNIFVGRS